LSGSASESYACNQPTTTPYYTIGNIRSKGSVTYTYPAAGATRPHAPTNVSTLGNYTYDASGNRSSDPTYSTFGYDIENRLTSLGSPAVLTNTYDGDSKRLIRVANGTTTHYVGEWYEFNPTTNRPTVYDPFNGQAVAMKQGSSLYYLHHDHLGSLVSVMDTST
jgi:hypothetical protein